MKKNKPTNPLIPLLCTVIVVAAIPYVFIIIPNLNNDRSEDADYTRKRLFGSYCEKLTRDQCISSSECICTVSSKLGTCGGCRKMDDTDYAEIQAERKICEDTGGTWQKSYCNCPTDWSVVVSSGHGNFNTFDKRFGCIPEKELCKKNNGIWCEETQENPQSEEIDPLCEQDFYSLNYCVCSDGEINRSRQPCK